jgi:hypothetical protein
MTMATTEDIIIMVVLDDIKALAVSMFNLLSTIYTTTCYFKLISLVFWLSFIDRRNINSKNKTTD